MTNKRPSVLVDAIIAFLDVVAKNLPYGVLRPGETPIPAEVELLKAIGRATPVSVEDLVSIRERLDETGAYCLESFACRMAVHAARANDAAVLRAGVLGFVIDDGLVEWRDILIDMSIVEDCALRVGTSIEAIMEGVIQLASDQRRVVIQEYLSRLPDMRGLNVMKVAVCGTGDGLTYARIQW